MAQHLSIRVPWHDNGWNGFVCNQPVCNSSCLRLANIYESRNDNIESEICGQCMAGHEQDLPCIGEGFSLYVSGRIGKDNGSSVQKVVEMICYMEREFEIKITSFRLCSKSICWMSA